MRAFGIICLLAASAAFLVACDPGIGLKIVNNTDSRLCWYEFERDGDDPASCSSIEPGESPRFSVICTNEMITTVVLTVGTNGPEIYAREATCGEWKRAGATVTVSKRAGQYVVEDGFD